MKALSCMASAAAIAAVTACATSEPAAPPSAKPVFQLSSPAFADGALLEKRHAGNVAANPNCVGQNVSPPLAWKNPPEGTRSFAMLTYDQDGRSGLGVVHWVAYGIPPSVSSFSESEVARPSPSYVGGKSTLNLPVYMGPCPPAGTSTHHYVFTIIATDVEVGALPAGLTMPELLERLKGHAKGSSSIVLRYGR
jgi:Raf kinase inhibitor-like YbhB/YbcL family protein